MDKNKTSRGAHAGVLFTSNRRSYWVFFFLLAFYMALRLTALQETASAQSCAQQCQQAYVQCLNGAGGDPVQMARCDDRYDSCSGACM
jgi:hypothetical protein